MHTTARLNAIAFVEKYLPGTQSLNVLDVGSLEVKNQGNLRDLFPGSKYIGMDICDGPNVDVVLKRKRFPFIKELFHVIISTSCFEHDATFWITFQEMVRVLRPGGLIYLNAPSAGHVHRYPADCYRFYPDAWKGLADWQGLTLLEQYIDNNCYWKNNVGIFKKPE